MSLSDLRKPTGGCINCKKCELVGRAGHFFCGTRRIPGHALFNKKGYCSKFEPKDKPPEDLIKKSISYRICTPSGCCSCSSLEGLQQMISQKSIISPITRIQKITTEDTPLPSFVREHNESLKQKKEGKEINDNKT